ncbi:MAG: prepilin-type N-terminal cleavage/methylation domain-containing protein [Gemmatimonadota bacterium]|nr:prepilin-type N-terminal cleavage/methylation domain-containing protein [Gemmatimonadota bacterium]
MNKTTVSRSARNRVCRSGSSGFTLVELIVVLVLLSVITSMALPRLNVIRWKMDTSARIARSSLQMAQRLAITRQHNVIVSFDLGNQRVRVAEDSNNTGGIEPSERVTYAVMDGARFLLPPAGVAGSTATGAVTGTNITTISGMPSIIFRRDGSSSSDLQLYLGSLRGDPDDVRAITVLPSTGRTQWFKYIQGIWKEGTV